MAEYRVFFRDSNGSIEARQEFSADGDAEAVESAAQLFEAFSGQCASYEVWTGTRLVEEVVVSTIRDEARFLRDQVARLRDVAKQCPSPVSDELEELARELEQRAAEVETKGA